MKKSAIIAVVLVVVAAGLIAYAYRAKPSPGQPGTNQSAVAQNNQTPTTTGTSTVPTVTTKPTGLHAGLTYSQAVIQYPNRIQFIGCSGHIGTGGQGNLSIAKGSKFMLDNRDPKAHTIAWATQSYRLAAYDFAIVSATKVGMFYITCDGGGSATINVSG